MAAFAAVLLLSVGTVGTAHADKASDTPAVEEVRTSAPKYFDFEDDQVEGDLQRPDGMLVTSIPRAKQGSLIEIRKDFMPEILKSLEDL